MCGAQEDAESDEQKRAPKSVQEERTESAAFCQTRGDGVRQSDADQERETGLNHVVQRAPCPLDVGLVVGKKTPDGVVRQSAGDFGKLQYFRHHEQHDETAVSINREIADKLCSHH